MSLKALGFAIALSVAVALNAVAAGDTCSRHFATLEALPPFRFQDLNHVGRAGWVPWQLEKKLDQLFSTTGFGNPAQFQTALASAGPHIQRAKRMLDSEDLEVIIAAPENVRSTVPHAGLQNFRQSGDSMGATLSRETVEANYAGVAVDFYNKLEPDLKPKYGYLAPKPDSGLTGPLGAAIYGPDHYIFDLEKIRKRLTLTPGDSLNRHMIREFGWDHQADAWDQLFIPWSRRDLLAPPLAEGLKESKFGFPMETYTFSELHVENLPSQRSRELIQLTKSPDPSSPVLWTDRSNWFPDLNNSLDRFQLSWDSSLDYLEAQIWGSLTLDDVKVFEFTQTPPSGAFLSELQRRHIEIRDARTKPPRPWSIYEN